MIASTTTRALTVLGVSALLTAGPGVLTSEASATTSTVAFATDAQCGPNNWVGWLVPDSPPGGADFHPACVNHDACYSEGSGTDRLSCDAVFRNELEDACATAGAGSTCYALAGTYHWAVRTFGSTYYKGNGANN